MAKTEVQKVVILCAKFFASIFITFAAGWIGSLFTTPNIPTWYAALEKPPLIPPNEIFGPVWSALYLLIGIALFLVWIAKDSRKKSGKLTAYMWFGAQLILNTLWSITFFSMQQPWLAAVVIALLIVSIIGTMVAFRKYDKWASYLFIPYLLWVGFATYLNMGVALLN